MWRRQRTAAAGCFLVLAAVASVDSRSLSKSHSEVEDGSPLKRAISISNGGGTAPNADDSRKASGNATREISAKKVVRVSDLTGDRGGVGDGGGGASGSISIVTQTLITFVTVFFFGCAIVLAIFAWKRFSDSPFRSVLLFVTLILLFMNE